MTVNDTTRTSEDGRLRQIRKTTEFFSTLPQSLDGQTETSLHQLLQSDEWRVVTLAAEKLLQDSLNWYTMTQKTLEVNELFP